MKRKLFATAALGLFLSAAVWLSVYSYRAVTANAPMEEPVRALPTIVIDAGHGGFDGGAVGADGIVEKDINLSIARRLYDLFTINGFEAVMTREEDTALNDDGLSTTRKRKNSDIHNRLALAKSYQDAILISIHQNKFTQSQYWGAQVFYGPKNPESQVFGEIMQRRMIEMLQPENTRRHKACGDSVYLIYNAPMPALLVECGFLSNAGEARKLITGEYQQRVAFTVFAATAEFLGMESPLKPDAQSVPGTPPAEPEKQDE